MSCHFFDSSKDIPFRHHVLGVLFACIGGIHRNTFLCISLLFTHLEGLDI